MAVLFSLLIIIDYNWRFSCILSCVCTVRSSLHGCFLGFESAFNAAVPLHDDVLMVAGV